MQLGEVSPLPIHLQRYSTIWTDSCAHRSSYNPCTISPKLRRPRISPIITFVALGTPPTLFDDATDLTRCS